MSQVYAEHASILVEAAKRRLEAVLDGGHPRRDEDNWLDLH
jgi:hypothetical protein